MEIIIIIIVITRHLNICTYQLLYTKLNFVLIYIKGCNINFYMYFSKCPSILQ